MKRKETKARKKVKKGLKLSHFFFFPLVSFLTLKKQSKQCFFVVFLFMWMVIVRKDADQK